jgi:dephospho-CoA kinase
MRKEGTRDMKVIAAVGRNVSGKDELLRYLQERCEMPILSAGDVAREIAHQEEIEPTRENLHEISQRMIRKHGEGFFMHRLIEKIGRADWDLVGISGVRTPADVQSLKDHFGEHLLLIHVKVGDPHIRFERSKARGADRDPQTYHDFLQQDQSEEELFHLNDTIRMSDLMILNHTSLEDFHARIEKEIINGILSNERCCS